MGSWTGGIQASQLIYSDKAWAGFEIENHLQASREQGRDAVRLDIPQSSASAYLNVLRVKTIEKIQAENLKLTRKNLERARVLMEIGVGGPEEVFLWESRITHSRRNCSPGPHLDPVQTGVLVPHRLHVRRFV